MVILLFSVAKKETTNPPECLDKANSALDPRVLSGKQTNKIVSRVVFYLNSGGDCVFYPLARVRHFFVVALTSMKKNW